MKPLLSIFATALAAGNLAAFSISADQGVRQPDGSLLYTVEAPAPGSYYLKTQANNLGAPGPDRFAIFRIDGGPALRRRVVMAAMPASHLEIERIVFRGKAVKVELTNPEEAVVTRLDFEPITPPPLPPGAADYRPKLTPPARHPRLLVNPAALEQVRHNLESAENRPVWELVKKIALAPYDFKFDPKVETGYDGKLIQALQCKAFYYLITGDKKVGHEAVKLAVDYLKVVNFGNGQDICRRTGETIYAASLVYDWCYALLGAEDKKVMIAHFLDLAESMETGWPPFKEPVVYGHANEAQMSRDQLAMAIAIYDEDPEPYRYLSFAMLEQLSPMKNLLYRSGRHDQGSAYGSYRTSYDLFAALQFERTFGHRLFSEDMAKVPYYFIYLRTPDGRLFADGDEFQADEYPGSDFMNMIAYTLFKDPVLKDEVRRIRRGGLAVSDPVLFLLLNDPALVSRDGRSELPLSRIFGDPRSGFVARTGWNAGKAADDAMVFFQGADYHYRNHNHLDAGSFQVYFRSLLLADIGQYNRYGTPYDWNFAKGTPSHTAMRLRDPDQKTRLMGPMFDLNTGTQEVPGWSPPPSHKAQTAGDYFRNGSVRFAALGPSQVCPFYTLMSVELAPSYPGRAVSFSRTVIFLNLDNREAPAALLLYDRLKLAKPAIVPISQFTAMVPPKVENQVLTFVSSGTPRESKLTLHTLLPREIEIAVKSGKDAHTLEGVHLPAPYPGHPAAQGTRVEITPATGADKSEFLQLMTLEDAPVEPLPYHWEAADGFRVVRIKDRVIAFPATDGLSDRPFEFTATLPSTQLLLPGVEAGDWEILRENTPLARVEVRPGENTLFAALAPGKYRVCKAAAKSNLPLSAVPPPPAPTPAMEPDSIYLDGKLQSFKLENGMLPLEPLLAALATDFTREDGVIRFRAGGGQIAVGDGKITMEQLVKPLELNVASDRTLMPPAIAAELLELRLDLDPISRSVLLQRRAPGKIRMSFTSAGSPALWRELVETGRGSFVVEGAGVVTEIMLRRAAELTGLEIAYNRGAERRSRFSVESSLDGKHFTLLFDGESSGKTADFETIRFPAPTAARLIRITFKGNSDNLWNNLSGLRLLTK
ncbi:MAG: discoidin domain-containing protein [Victivallaceae bacterium]